MSLGGLSARPQLFELLGNKITIVMYHAISHERDSYTISPEVFSHQIELLNRQYSIIPLREIGMAPTGDGLHQRRVVVTFDDAYCDFLDSAFPVLDHLTIPSTVFVPSGFIGEFNEWDSFTSGIPRRRLMTRRQLLELKNTGLVDFGSHTVDHVRMSTLQVSNMRQQAVASKQALEDLFGTPITMFAYPYGKLGDFSSRTRKILFESGYTIAVTTYWGTRQPKHEPLNLRRISFRDNDGDDVIQAKIEGQYDWIATKERIGFIWRTMKRGIPCLGGIGRRD